MSMLTVMSISCSKWMLTWCKYRMQWCKYNKCNTLMCPERFPYLMSRRKFEVRRCNTSMKVKLWKWRQWMQEDVRMAIQPEQPLVGAKLMSTLSSRCLLAPTPFVKAKLISTPCLRCLSILLTPFVWLWHPLRCLLASDGATQGWYQLFSLQCLHSMPCRHWCQLLFFRCLLAMHSGHWCPSSWCQLFFDICWQGCKMRLHPSHSASYS